MAPVACAQTIGPINCRTAASRGYRPRRQYGTYGVSSLFDTHQATVTPGRWCKSRRFLVGGVLASRAAWGLRTSSTSPVTPLFFRSQYAGGGRLEGRSSTNPKLGWSPDPLEGTMLLDAALDFYAQ
jgi:hypothetical protein